VGHCFDQKDIFPSIQEAIERLCKREGEAVREAIVDELLKDPEAAGIIDRAIGLCPKFKRRWIAGNTVDWLSVWYDKDSADLSAFYHRFNREKRDGIWAYFLR
jgi:hypothetical protein